MISEKFPDQSGSLLIAALLMLLGLSLTVFMAARIAMTNSQMMRNNRVYRDHLYRAETLISLAAEQHRETWLTEDSNLFDLNDGDAAVVESDLHLTDKSGESVYLGVYEIARLEGNPEEGSVSERFYEMAHTGPPSIGSGTSGQMTARRYGILATGTNDRSTGEVVLEAGFSRIF